MNPVKLFYTWELMKLLKLKERLAAEGADVGYIDQKIADLELKLQ